jgi:ssDNA-binding Zn-finger/Zn-ribbon topoisomerase 1
MRFLQCPQCRFTQRDHPSLSTCPRCRIQGRPVELVELAAMPRPRSIHTASSQHNKHGPILHRSP